ncbi:dihydrodipicolinate synthase family protein [Streptomyces mesophilus]|uniref:dihydrodipicolinate synthase family protein n=1 Tax=Streptomyces mesophilus TaxID=1775132 RepID=UPI003333DC8A
MFTGLSAFPLTPFLGTRVDERAFTGLVSRLTAAGVDLIGALGSTGNYAYLSREERAHVARLAVDVAEGTPVMVGIGALRTSDVLALAEDAQQAGARAVLLAPMTYQALTAEEVFGLYEDVTRELSVPLCLYDNPGTTHVDLSDELYARIAQLPNVASVKIPGVPEDPGAAADRIQALRKVLPEATTIGVSGDWYAATGLNAGCDAWYSVLGGTFPQAALDITRAAAARDAARVSALSDRLEPMWALFRRHGSLRVMTAAAEQLGLIAESSLPRPLRKLDRAVYQEVAAALDLTGLA